MKYSCILIIAFLLSCGNKENTKPVLKQTSGLDTINIDVTKDGFIITLNRETAKKIIAPASGVGLYKTHKQIYASSVGDLAKNIRTSSLGHISEPKSLELAHNLKRKAANKWLGKFTIVYTIGTTVSALIDIKDGGKMTKAQERFDNTAKKK